jgi:hypothetical protein
MVVMDARKRYDVEALVGKLDLAVDWVQVVPSSWLLWTTSSPAKWMERLRKVLPEDTTILITQINPDERAGVVDEVVATFLRKTQAKLEKLAG